LHALPVYVRSSVTAFVSLHLRLRGCARFATVLTRYAPFPQLLRSLGLVWFCSHTAGLHRLRCGFCITTHCGSLRLPLLPFRVWLRVWFTHFCAYVPVPRILRCTPVTVCYPQLFAFAVTLFRFGYYRLVVRVGSVSHAPFARLRGLRVDSFRSFRDVCIFAAPRFAVVTLVVTFAPPRTVCYVVPPRSVGCCRAFFARSAAQLLAHVAFAFRASRSSVWFVRVWLRGWLILRVYAFGLVALVVLVLLDWFAVVAVRVVRAPRLHPTALYLVPFTLRFLQLFFAPFCGCVPAVAHGSFPLFFLLFAFTLLPAPRLFSPCAGCAFLVTFYHTAR